MLKFEEYLAKVNDAISAIPYPKEPSQLYQPIAYTMALGGKRLRPVLTLMACEAMGSDANLAIDAAVGIELFHNFTLLHDDVMDKAAVRRGQPTVHRRWNENVAILSGDAMLTMAMQYVMKTDIAPEMLQPVMEVFNTTAMEIYEGQQWDMDYEQRAEVTEDDYLEMIRLKTSVLLGCACKVGALIAGADVVSVEALYELGLNLGLAFQLQDDVLDVWGDEATFGKEIGGDIMNNKKTYLLINALNRAEGDDLGELRRWITDEYAMRQEKVPAVRAIYERLGLRKLAQEAIAAYTQKALDCLAQVQMDEDDRKEFAEFINRLVDRSK